MSSIDKTELTDRIKGMSEEEMQLTAKMIPSDLLWDELRRRDNINRSVILGIKGILKVDV